MSFFKKTITKLKRFGRQISPTQDNWKSWCYHQLKRGYEKQELETQLTQAGLQKQLNDNPTYLDELYKNNQPVKLKTILKTKWNYIIGNKEESKLALLQLLLLFILSLLLIGIIYLLLIGIIYLLVNYGGYVLFALLVILVGTSMSSRSIAWFGACTLGLFSLFNRYED